MQTTSNWEPYLRSAGAFCDPAKAHSSGLYELARNWRIAYEIARGRPFAVVNLAQAQTLDATTGMDRFKTSLRESPEHTFMPLSWSPRF